MAFEIRYAAEAENDLDQILLWLLKGQAGEAGLRWYQGLKDKINTLVEMPRRCVKAPESKARQSAALVKTLFRCSDTGRAEAVTLRIVLRDANSGKIGSASVRLR